MDNIGKLITSNFELISKIDDPSYCEIVTIQNNSLKEKFDNEKESLDCFFKRLEYFGFTGKPIEFFPFWMKFISLLRSSIKWVHDKKSGESSTNATQMRSDISRANLGKKDGEKQEQVVTNLMESIKLLRSQQVS